jgi:hypothetical protein
MRKFNITDIRRQMQKLERELYALSHSTPNPNRSLRPGARRGPVDRGSRRGSLPAPLTASSSPQAPQFAHPAKRLAQPARGRPRRLGIGHEFGRSENPPARLAQ